MALWQPSSAASVARALAARPRPRWRIASWPIASWLIASCLIASCIPYAHAAARADDLDDALSEAPVLEAPTEDAAAGEQVFDEPALDAPQLDAPAAADESQTVPPAAPLAPTFTMPAHQLLMQDPAQLVAPEAEQLEDWQPAMEPSEMLAGPQPPPADLRPFDWLHHWGFHHSSTEGPFLDRGLPMERTSWLNRPYHVDWFLGPLLSDGPVDGRVEQSNDLFGGLRVGWDFDYYWGVEWRFGWSNPVLIADSIEGETPGDYFVSDIDFIYYPWGDTKVRPFVQWGLGMTQIGSVRSDGTGQEATLLSMPLGLGVQFPLTHWALFRLDIIDNLAFGADGVDTLNNFAFTAGMEMRLGARPNSYWPWRSSRTIW